MRTLAVLLAVLSFALGAVACIFTDNVAALSWCIVAAIWFGLCLYLVRENDRLEALVEEICDEFEEALRSE